MKPIRLLLKRALMIAAAMLALFYAGDGLYVRYRMSAQKPGDPFDVLVYPRILEIPQKGRHVEYALDALSPMESMPCVHSVFPHYGYAPCWYVSRKSQDPIPMALVPLLRRPSP